MRELVEIVIKVFASYLVFSTAGNYVPLALVPGTFSGATSPAIWFFASGLSVPIVIGMVLWFRAPKISKAAFSSETSGPVIPENGVVAAGVFLIGIYWFVRSVSVLLTQLGSQASINFGWCVVLLLSVGLILGNSFIAKLFRKVRAAGNDA